MTPGGRQRLLLRDARRRKRERESLRFQAFQKRVTDFVREAERLTALSDPFENALDTLTDFKPKRTLQ